MCRFDGSPGGSNNEISAISVHNVNNADKQKNAQFIWF